MRSVEAVLLVLAGLGALMLGVSRGLVPFARWRPDLAVHVRWLFDSPVDLSIDYGAGDVERALQGVRALKPAPPPLEAYRCVLRANTAVAAGEYREALRVAPRGMTKAAMRADFSANYCVVVINKAEALYNLGRWRRAEVLMCGLAGSGLMRDALSQAGCLVQLAWIAAHTGRPEVAGWLLEAVCADSLPRDYRAETSFCQAAVALVLGDAVAARRRLDESRRRLIRASSKRNERFLRARVEAAAGNLPEAARLCEEASGMRYRGQGGDGLLLWGEVLQKLGDADGARRAWALAVERDPHSESARAARLRLSAAPLGQGQADR